MKTSHLTFALGVLGVVVLLAGCTGMEGSSRPSHPAASSTSPEFRSEPCRGEALRGAIDSGSGGAAGSLLPNVVVTNTATTACTLTGWPTIALVARAGGDPVGARSVRNLQVAHPTVTLPPHGTATIPIRIAQALNYPASTCDPETASGMSITPPGSSTALYVPLTGLTGCRNKSMKLIHVSAVIPSS